MPRLRLNVLIALSLAASLGLLSGISPTAASAQLAGPGFGASTGIAGDHVVVGEPNSVRRPGTVYVYAAGDGGWSETGR